MKTMKESKEAVISRNIVAEVEKLCKEKGISRAELSRKLFVSRSYITQIFKGRKLLNLSLICSLEEVLNINLISISNNHE